MYEGKIVHRWKNSLRVIDFFFIKVNQNLTVGTVLIEPIQVQY